MEERSIKVGSVTPWGYADRVVIHDNGIVEVTTASHGGIYVPPHLNLEIPTQWRRAGYKGLPMQGWYEEDCDWCMVALCYPEGFNQAARDAAQLTFDWWIKPKL